MTIGGQPNLPLRVAGVLKYFQISALILLVLGVILDLLDSASTAFVCLIGAGIIALSPVAGILTVAIFSLRHGNRRLLLYATLILAVYAAAFLLAR